MGKPGVLLDTDYKSKIHGQSKLGINYRIYRVTSKTIIFIFYDYVLYNIRIIMLGYYILS